ncbi:hypothetical protein PAQ31011_05118 [Pandoraea aquatica]|uniref:Uncharacterized protein n=1 Tax=Pandoraea aquatica TaxID=2508290 RepID=A0A5E4Z650_9BURK|nr:hypothetical protein PAQ31011_05118 [Pandoraea aquatica]
MSKSKNDSLPQSSTTGVPDESTTKPTDKQQDSSRAITEQWINNAMRGIKEMNENEQSRQEVAKRLF